MFRKGKTHIIAKFHRTDLDNCGHSRRGNPVLYLNKYGIYFLIELTQWDSSNEG